MALKLPITVQAAFEVLVLSEAIKADGDDCSVRIRELLQNFDVTSVAQNPEYLRVLAAGSARALLRLPFSPCVAVLEDAVALLADDSATGFLKSILHAAASGLELGKLPEEHGHSLPELIARRQGALAALSSAMEAAKLSGTRYTRATNVWRRLISGRGPLGGPVSEYFASPEDLIPADGILAELRDQRPLTNSSMLPIAS